MSKVLDYKFEGSKLIASVNVDPNGDGQSVLKIDVELELSEIPDEVFSAVSKKKAE